MNKNKQIGTNLHKCLSYPELLNGNVTFSKLNTIKWHYLWITITRSGSPTGILNEVFEHNFDHKIQTREHPVQQNIVLRFKCLFSIDMNLFSISMLKNEPSKYDCFKVFLSPIWHIGHGHVTYFGRCWKCLLGIRLNFLYIYSCFYVKSIYIAALLFYLKLTIFKLIDLRVREIVTTIQSMWCIPVIYGGVSCNSTNIFFLVGICFRLNCTQDIGDIFDVMRNHLQFGTLISFMNGIYCHSSSLWEL